MTGLRGTLRRFLRDLLQEIDCIVFAGSFVPTRRYVQTSGGETWAMVLCWILLHGLLHLLLRFVVISLYIFFLVSFSLLLSFSIYVIEFPHYFFKFIYLFILLS